MTKEEIDMIDKFLLKLGKMKGDAFRNPDTGAFEVMIKKADLIREINEFVNKMKDIKPE